MKWGCAEALSFLQAQPRGTSKGKMTKKTQQMLLEIVLWQYALLSV